MPTRECPRCGEAAKFQAEISQLGEYPGARVYHCGSCDRVVWVDKPAQQQQQQQQQIQRDPKD